MMVFWVLGWVRWFLFYFGVEEMCLMVKGLGGDVGGVLWC